MSINTRWARAALAPALALAVVLPQTGCQTYQPQPLDLEAFNAAWSLPDFESPAWAQAADHAGLSTTPDPSAGIDLPAARAIALYGNPALRRARLEAGVQQAVAQHAGRWDDPELGVDLLKNLDLSQDPWIFGVSLGFTIPLSGRLDAAQRQADAQVIASWQHIVHQEWMLVRQLNEAWTTWSSTTKRRTAMNLYLQEVQQLADTASALARAGELAPTDARLLRIDAVQAQLEERRLESQAQRQHQTLLTLMGLRPDTNLPLTPQSPTAEMTTSNHPLAPQSIDDDTLHHEQLTAHPAVRAALADYEVAERDLQREIRKQYPDLTLGPAYEIEEGQSRIGLGLGIPLPILNANRGGIAQARAARDVARVNVEAAYQNATTQYARATQRWHTAQQIQDATEDQLAPLAEAQVAEARALLELGEVDVLLLHQALSAVSQARLAVIEADAEEDAAALDLHQLNPPAPQATAPKQEPTP